MISLILFLIIMMSMFAIGMYYWQRKYFDLFYKLHYQFKKDLEKEAIKKVGN